MMVSKKYEDVNVVSADDDGFMERVKKRIGAEHIFYALFIPNYFTSFYFMAKGDLFLSMVFTADASLMLAIGNFILIHKIKDRV